MNTRTFQLTESQARRILALLAAAACSDAGPGEEDISIGNQARVVLASFAAERTLSPEEASAARRRRAMRQP